MRCKPLKTLGVGSSRGLPSEVCGVLVAVTALDVGTPSGLFAAISGVCVRCCCCRLIYLKSWRFFSDFFRFFQIFFQIFFRFFSDFFQIFFRFFSDFFQIFFRFFKVFINRLIIREILSLLYIVDPLSGRSAKTYNMSHQSKQVFN